MTYRYDDKRGGRTVHGLNIVEKYKTLSTKEQVCSCFEEVVPSLPSYMSW